MSKKLSLWHVLRSCYYLFIRKEILLYILGGISVNANIVLKWKYLGEELPLIRYLYKL